MNDEKTQVVQPAISELSEQPEPLQVEEVLSVSRPEIAAEPYTAQCGKNDIVTSLHEVVTRLEAKSLLYGTQPLTDCSGIFHRVLLGLKHRCPGQEYPSVTKHRDSRAIARWYHERGKLTLIENSLEHTNLIKSGTVLFFGRNDSVYKDFFVVDLLHSGRGIDHLGVVVKVHKNRSGNMLRYELFHGHGRRGKTAASITDWHRRTPTRAGYPPFGNGRQQLVAVARM